MGTTETGRIRWKQGDDRTFAVSHGYVGTIETQQFSLYEPDRNAGGSHAAEWLLTSGLAGQDRMQYGVDRDELEAEAERWLEEFVQSLGAVFPAEPVSAERPGKRKLGDADILDAFRTVTNWSDAEVLHYESGCDVCDPFASLVCEDWLLIVKPQLDAETGQ